MSITWDFMTRGLVIVFFFDLVEVKKIGEYGGGGSDLWSSKTMFLLTRIFQCCF